MQFLDKTLDESRDLCATPRLSRWLAYVLVLIVLAGGAAYYWDKFEWPARKGKKGNVTPESPAAIPVDPGPPNPTGR